MATRGGVKTSRRKVVAIVQSRLGSSRLPGKALLPIGRLPLIQLVVERLRRAKTVDEVLVATTIAAEDNGLAAFCREENISVFRGSEDDVLDRFYQAAVAASADVVVRVAGDCPFIDPQIVDRVVGVYLGGDDDYLANNFGHTYPEGLDTEVFSLSTLEAAWRDARSPHDRTQVTSFLRSGKGFRVGEVAHTVDLSTRELRLTIDEPADLEFARAVYQRLDDGGAHFGLDDVLQLLDQEPGLRVLNVRAVDHAADYLALSREPPLPPSHVQGNAFLDYGMAGADFILGHPCSAVDDAAQTLTRVDANSAPVKAMANEIAQTLTGLIPGADRVVFVDSPAAAVATALQLARSFSRREHLAACRSPNGRDRDPSDSKTVHLFGYNRLDELERLFAARPHDIAAVMLEPAGVETPAPRFLQCVKALAQQHGALLIFDETLSGLRFALGGAAAFYGTTPDLTLLGKALGNGYSICAVLGAARAMPAVNQGLMRLAGGVSAPAIAAARATLIQLTTGSVVAQLWEQGGRLRDGFNVLANHYGLGQLAECHGPGPLTRVVMRGCDVMGPEAMEAIVRRQSFQRGLLFTGFQSVNARHGREQIDQTLRIHRSVLELLATAIHSARVSATADAR